MKSGKLQVSIFLIIFSFFFVNDIFAGSVSKLSNIFTLDTRTEELPPVDGWQILTNKGDTYNEDLIIDNNGKVWCFYFRSPGGNQPIYLKIFKSDSGISKRKIKYKKVSKRDVEKEKIKETIKKLKILKKL